MAPASRGRRRSRRRRTRRSPTRSGPSTETGGSPACGGGRSARRPTYTLRVQETLDVPNQVAAELAGIGDGVLDSLRERLECTIRLRGNRLTIEGDEQHVVEARAVVDELV